MKKIVLIALLLVGAIFPRLSVAQEASTTSGISEPAGGGSGDGGVGADYGGDEGN